jgi:hypothetical protein
LSRYRPELPLLWKLDEGGLLRVRDEETAFKERFDDELKV